MCFVCVCSVTSLTFYLTTCFLAFFFRKNGLAMQYMTTFTTDVARQNCPPGHGATTSERNTTNACEWLRALGRKLHAKCPRLASRHGSVACGSITTCMCLPIRRQYTPRPQKMRERTARTRRDGASKTPHTHDEPTQTRELEGTTAKTQRKLNPLQRTRSVASCIYNRNIVHKVHAK